MFAICRGLSQTRPLMRGVIGGRDEYKGEGRGLG